MMLPARSGPDRAPVDPRGPTVEAMPDEHLLIVRPDAGADDSVNEPFRLTKLTARIRAQLRRVEARPIPVGHGDLVVQAVVGIGVPRL